MNCLGIDRGTGKRSPGDGEDGRSLNERNVQSTEYGITLSSTRISGKNSEIPEAQAVLKKLALLFFR